MFFVIPCYQGYKSLVLGRDHPLQPQVGTVMIVCVCVLNRIMTEATKAREKLDDAEQSLHRARQDLGRFKEELVGLFDPTRYGAEGEWKKLHNVCLKKDTGG